MTMEFNLRQGLVWCVWVNIITIIPEGCTNRDLTASSEGGGIWNMTDLVSLVYAQFCSLLKSFLLIYKVYHINTRNYFRLHLFAVLFHKDCSAVIGIHARLEEIFLEC